MKTTKLLLAALLSSPLVVSAQGPGGPGGPGGPPPMEDPLTKILDRNEDGKLSAGEIKRAATALLKLDKDDDDALSAEELKPEEPKKLSLIHI